MTADDDPLRIEPAPPTHRSADTWPRHRAKARRQRALRARIGRRDPAADDTTAHHHDNGRNRRWT